MIVAEVAMIATFSSCLCLVKHVVFLEEQFEAVCGYSDLLESDFGLAHTLIKTYTTHTSKYIHIHIHTHIYLSFGVRARAAVVICIEPGGRCRAYTVLYIFL